MLHQQVVQFPCQIEPNFQTKSVGQMNYVAIQDKLKAELENLAPENFSHLNFLTNISLL